ncbi:MAG: endonuclease/exonuclease/phosphatase family protein [Bacteroidales bacterium]|nr:endonuclease/exonuclease/phosphatase family protein [Bacteroidales bacterium]
MALTVAIGFFFVSTATLHAGHDKGEKEFIAVAIGFYNVENLFDTINDPNIRDDDFTPQGSNRWNTEKYFEKLENLAEVIYHLGRDVNPDGVAVLGLAEVENVRVLEDLAAQEKIRDRNYQIIFVQGPDRRGVHNAFFYNPAYFEHISHEAYPTIVPGRPDFITRDQLLLTGNVLGERMHFIVGHWPSRVGGEARSRPGRIAAADIARNVIDSIQAAEPGAKVFMMGDFNDNPTDISIRKHLRSKGTKEGIKDNELYNPFESFFRRGIGTNAWRDAWSLFDQILMTPAVLGDDFSTFTYLRAEVFNRPFLRQPTGRFQGYPFRTFGGGVYLGGYSDHFPVCVYLIREHKKD